MKVKLYGGRDDGAEMTLAFPPDGSPTRHLIVPWVGMPNQLYIFREIRDDAALYDFVGPCDIWGKTTKPDHTKGPA